MEGPVCLRTARLRLEPWTLADLDAAHALWTQPGVRRYLWDDQLISRETASGPLATSAADFAALRFGLWGCCLGTSTEPAGFCGLRRADLMPEPELLFGIADHWQRQGLGQEAARAVIDYAFSVLELSRLGAATDPPNVASQRLLARLGFRLVRQAEHAGHPTLFYELAR